MNRIEYDQPDPAMKWQTVGARVTELIRDHAALRATVVQLTARVRRLEVAAGIPMVYVPKREEGETP